MPYDPAFSSLLAAGIEALDSGITVFDEQLHLVAVNQRFFQLIGIPPTVAAPGTPLEELFRYNAEHGEYGDGDAATLVAERLALARQFQPHTFERERPDGRIIEVRGTPLPLGGFVTIYTDITVQRRREQALERLRAELEQRVAERTAELARKTAQLEKVMAHIRHGITLFNSDLELELYNHQFLQSMRFPGGFAWAGRPFADFIRYNAERGEYGPGDTEQQVHERVDQARNPVPHHFERTRPDGSTIEIIGTPTADGGFVTTYIDVSARKQAEANLLASEQRFRDFASAATDWFFETDAQLRYTWFSDRLREVTGMSAERAIGKRREEFVDPSNLTDNPQLWAQHLAQLQAHQPYRDFTYRQRDSQGQWRDIMVSAVPAFDDTGSFLGYRGTGREVTALKAVERALQDSEAQMRAILEASPVGVAVVSSAQRVVRACNARMAELMGCGAVQELLDQPLQGACLDLFSQVQELVCKDSTEVPVTRADGSTWWALLSVRALDYRGENSLLVWVYDVSELRRARESMQHMALHDPLTDLANRRYLQQLAQQALDRAQRQGTRGALIYLDLDGFKAVNDRFGHQQGDALLVAIAQQLQARLRRTDFLARVGGDEFAIVIEDIPNDQDPVELAREIHLLVGEVARAQLPALAASVGASAGVAYFGVGDVALDQLLIRADAAMYRAKAEGRGRVCVA